MSGDRYQKANFADTSIWIVENSILYCRAEESYLNNLLTFQLRVFDHEVVVSGETR